MDDFSETLLKDNGIRVHAEFDGYRGRILVAVNSSADGPVPDVVLNGERVA